MDHAWTAAICESGSGKLILSEAFQYGEVNNALSYAIGFGIFMLFARLFHMVWWAKRLAIYPSSGGWWNSFKRLFHPPTKGDEGKEYLKDLRRAHEEGFLFNYLVLFLVVAVSVVGL